MISTAAPNGKFVRRIWKLLKMGKYRSMISQLVCQKRLDGNERCTAMEEDWPRIWTNRKQKPKMQNFREKDDINALLAKQKQYRPSQRRICLKYHPLQVINPANYTNIC
jgi:hypothetical protein